MPTSELPCTKPAQPDCDADAKVVVLPTAKWYAHLRDSHPTAPTRAAIESLIDGEIRFQESLGRDPTAEGESSLTLVHLVRAFASLPSPRGEQ